jgi:hypothetical protein
MFYIIKFIIVALVSSTFLTKNNFQDLSLTPENSIVALVLLIVAFFIIKTIFKMIIFSLVLGVIAFAGYSMNISNVDLKNESLSESYDKVKTRFFESIEDQEILDIEKVKKKVFQIKEQAEEKIKEDSGQ